MSLLDWSTNPANNTLKPGIDWSTSMLPSQVNDSARGMMADVALWLTAPTFPNGLGNLGDVTVGNVTASGYVDARTPASGGGVRIRANASTGTAVLQVTNADATATIGSISFSAGGAMNWTGAFNTVGALTQNGQQVWHTGNFNPVNYQPALGYTPASRAGDTFTGSVAVPSLAASGQITAGRFARDTYFTLDLVTGNPFVTLDNLDHFAYDRTANKFVFIVNNAVVASIDGSGTLRVLGNVIGNTAP